MIDSETGMQMTFPTDQTASTQPVSAPTPMGQGAGQGGGISPLMLMLLQRGVGGLPGSGLGGGSPGSGQGGTMSPLVQYLLGGGVVPGSGQGGATLAQLLQQQQPQQPQFGAPTPDQQSWMSQMGWGNDLNALTPMQRGGLNTALGTTQGPNAIPNAQYNTPQDFVQQWRQMFGST